MVLCAVFILGLHFNVNWRFDSTMQIFFSIQIFAIHFYVNLLSPNWYSYANFLLGHWCTLLTCKLGNLSHLKERHLKRHRVEFVWQRKYKAKWYSHVFALVLEKFLLLLWNSCSRQYEGVVRSIVCTLTDGQPHQIHALGDWIEPPWITLERTGWMSNRGTPRLHKQVKTKEGKGRMKWVEWYLIAKDSTLFSIPGKGKSSATLSLRSTLRFHTLIRFSERPGLKDEQTSWFLER